MNTRNGSDIFRELFGEITSSAERCSREQLELLYVAIRVAMPDVLSLMDATFDSEHKRPVKMHSRVESTLKSVFHDCKMFLNMAKSLESMDMETQKNILQMILKHLAKMCNNCAAELRR